MSVSVKVSLRLVKIINRNILYIWLWVIGHWFELLVTDFV